MKISPEALCQAPGQGQPCGQPALVLEWVTRIDRWCALRSIDFSHPLFKNFEGVYIIWHGGKRAKTLYIGQGLIAESLANYQTDPRILHYSNYGLWATWARVPSALQAGVARFLEDELQPTVVNGRRAAVSIPVNLPWQSWRT